MDGPPADASCQSLAGSGPDAGWSSAVLVPRWAPQRGHVLIAGVSCMPRRWRPDACRRGEVTERVSDGAGGRCARADPSLYEDSRRRFSSGTSTALSRPTSRSSVTASRLITAGPASASTAARTAVAEGRIRVPVLPVRVSRQAPAAARTFRCRRCRRSRPRTPRPPTQGAVAIVAAVLRGGSTTGLLPTRRRDGPPPSEHALWVGE